MTPGTPVLYSGAFGRAAPVPAIIVGVGEEYGSRVYDVELANGEVFWAYEFQIEEID